MAVGPVLVLLSLLAQTSEAGRVRIGMLGLLSPEAIQLRVNGPGEGTVLLLSQLDPDSDGPARWTLSNRDRVTVKSDRRRLAVLLVTADSKQTQSAFCTEIRLLPADSTPIEISIPRRLTRTVRGELSISLIRRPAGREALRVVLITDLESAVASVVAAEVAGVPTLEAAKALSVVSRSYMSAHRGRHQAEGFDYCDTTHCQFYRGEDDLRSSRRRLQVSTAVAATRGESLSFNGRVVEGYYSAACGGMTATPTQVWGGAPSSGYVYRRIACDWCRSSPHWRWRRSADATRVLAALAGVLGFSPSPGAALITAGEGQGGTIESIIVSDGLERRKLGVEEFRHAVGSHLGWNTVRSPSFTIQRRGEWFVFEGRGFGSQVGLCVAGALAQAARGRSYREILAFYYPGAEITARQAATATTH